MANHTLHDAFLDDLRDMLGAEKQLLKALPRMVKKASAAKLRAAFSAHLDDTKGHVAIAGHGLLIAWGRVLEYPKVVSLLELTLAQENGADKTLTGLADDGINKSAAVGLRDLVG